MVWRKACDADLSEGQCKGVLVEGREIAIYRSAGWHATSNVCTHQRALLTDGFLEGEFIECPLHQGRFSIVTGQAEGPPVKDPIRVYPISVKDDGVWVDVEPA